VAGFICVLARGSQGGLLLAYRSSLLERLRLGDKDSALDFDLLEATPDGVRYITASCRFEGREATLLVWFQVFRSLAGDLDTSPGPPTPHGVAGDKGID
jgi:hypothetical protein